MEESTCAEMQVLTLMKLERACGKQVAYSQRWLEWHCHQMEDEFQSWCWQTH